jgi:hypothetical protein
MVARISVRLTLALLLPAALAVLLVASESAAFTSFGHSRLGSAPVRALATNDASQPPVSAENGTANAKPGSPVSAKQAPAISGGIPPPSAWSGGPEDAGPDVVYQAPVNRSQTCGPKPCRRP